MEELRNETKEGGKFKPVNPCQPSLPVTSDDVILSLNAGAGGIGDPLDREPERVLADVQRRIFSLEMGKNVFGVVIVPETETVDKEATESQREKIKARRKERGKI